MAAKKKSYSRDRNGHSKESMAHERAEYASRKRMSGRAKAKKK